MAGMREASATEGLSLFSADEALCYAAQDGLFLGAEQEEAGGKQHAGGGG